MATATVKPTANSVTSLRYGNWTSPASAYDLARNDLSTSANGYANATAPTKGNSTGTLILSGIPALPAGTYTSKTLYVNWSAAVIDDFGALGPALTVSYSLDGGSTYFAFTGGSGLTDGSGQLSKALALGQDLSLVRVKAVTTVYGDGLSDCMFSAQIYDAFVDGIYTPIAGSGKKAAASTGN